MQVFSSFIKLQRKNSEEVRQNRDPRIPKKKNNN